MKILFPIFWALVVIGLIEVSNAATTRFDSVIANGSLSVGDTAAANSKAIVDLKSTTKGMLPPRMTTAQRDAITSPPTGLVVFNTSTNKLNSYNGTSWTEVGSGSGGTLNYIQQTTPGNYDAETNATTGWNTYDDAAATPVDGTGGSFGGTFAVTPSPFLRGTYSFKYTPGTAGEGASYDFTIDAADKGKMLQIEFDYSLSATITEGDYTVWIYDVTNATLTQPAPYKLSGTTGTNYKFQSEFQTASNSVSYRVLVHQATSPSAHIVFDNFKVGPANLTRGPPVTDWVSFTPTGSWVANSTYTGYWRRVGDQMEVHFRIALSGAPTAASLTVNLPSGYTIDTSKITALATTVVGAGNLDESAGNSNIGARINYNSTTSVSVNYIRLSGSLYDYPGVNATTPVTFGNTDNVSGTFIVPISGWSSSVIMSSDADTRVVAFSATKLSTQAIGPNNSVVKITWDVPALASGGKDTHGVFDDANDRYVVAVPGDYQFNAQVFFQATNVLANDYDIRLYKNGSLYRIGSYRRMTVSTAGALNLSTVAPGCVAGDYFEIYVYGAGNNSVSTVTVDNGYNGASFTGFKLSGPSQIAASETVAAQYYMSASTANTSFADDVFEQVDYDTKSFDTHNAVTTGASWKFTAPVSGIYQVYVKLRWANATNLADTDVIMKKNGAQYLTSFDRLDANITGRFELGGSMLVRLLAGDYIEIWGSQNDSAAGARNVNTTSRNYVDILRVGNY